MKSKKLVIEKLATGIINLDSITFPENVRNLTFLKSKKSYM